jgi:NADPH:quinone reductase-like Zn-dependent oxidoreductase
MIIIVCGLKDLGKSYISKNLKKVMKALVYDQYTTDDNFSKILKIKDIPSPEPKSSEVVFKVKVAALNYDDIWGMRGKPLAIPLPHISGTDAAGEVTAVGSDVKNIKVGDRVVSHGNLSCRVCKACTDGREYDCRKRTIWGFETGPLWGGYCEETHLPEVNVVKIPEGVSYDDAAAASMTLVTSWHMLVGRAKIQPGQLVLIMGGSSGVGNFGIQIAKLFGCTVIATASPDKLDKLLELGADYAINHRDDNWHKEVRSITKNIPKPFGDISGVDVIFEHIGGSHWNKELTLLNYGGTIVTTGATTGYDAKTDLRHIFFKGINILGSTQGTRAELEQGLYWMSQGKIKSVIDSVYTLDQAAEAHTKMLKGKGLFGKILMKPNFDE